MVIKVARYKSPEISAKKMFFDLCKDEYLMYLSCKNQISAEIAKQRKMGYLVELLAER